MAAGAQSQILPHPASLSRGVREEKPFSLRKKGRDEGRFSSPLTERG
jgi:hypothetical protein